MARAVINCDIDNVIELYACLSAYEVKLLLSDIGKRESYAIITNYKAMIGYTYDFEDFMLYLLNGGELDD